MTVEEQIREYIIQNLTFGEDTIGSDNNISLLEAGIVDSVGVMELVLFVEETYNLEIDDNEIVPENFDSITNLANYVRMKQDS